MTKITSALMIILLISISQAKILVMEVEDLRKLSGGDPLSALRELNNHKSSYGLGFCTDSEGMVWNGFFDLRGTFCPRDQCFSSKLKRTNTERIDCTGGVKRQSKRLPTRRPPK